MMKRILSTLLALCLLLCAAPIYTDAAAVKETPSGGKEFPKLSKEEIVQLLDDNPIWREQYDPYYEAPSCDAPYSIGQVKDVMLQEAAGRLNALRRIAGLPAVTLDYDMCETAQYGAVLLTHVQQISHYVSRPSDMPKDFYSKADKALQSGNLAGGSTMQTLFLHQVEGWMYDSDAANIFQLGHRNWQLNPTMGKVGFGYAGFASVEMSHDRSGAGCDYDYISWPASGNFPTSITLFKYAAWSVSLNQDVYRPFTPENVTVKLVRQSDGAVWNFSMKDRSNTNDPDANYFNAYINSGIGIGNCIIFRPGAKVNNYRDSLEGVYTVTVSGLEKRDGSRDDLVYTVDLFDPEDYRAKDEPEPPFDPSSVKADPNFEIDGEGTLVKYWGPGGQVVVPDGVRHIGKEAFASWGGHLPGKADNYDNNRKITSVYLPDSVTRIDEHAFYGTTGMTSIRLSNNLKVIGDSAFDVSRLTSVYIPDSVTAIGKNAFSGNPNLTAVRMPSSLKEFGSGMFVADSNLQSVTLPSNLVTIPSSTFLWCSKLTSVSIPGSVLRIDDFAFNDCTGLKDVYYGGTTAKWRDLDLRKDNEAVSSATIHYESAMATFTDLDARAYYLDAVSWAVKQGVTTGTAATTFSPGKTCTHGEILTFLWRAAGKPASSAQPPIDMTGKEFYYDAAKWAAEKGMIGADFNPNAPCNRAYAVLYIWQAFDRPAPAGTTPFTDVPAHWSSAPAVAWALEKGVTTGATATAFNPSGICSRGQIVTFLYRAYSK